MPIRLTRNGDTLNVKLSGIADKDEFSEKLQRVKRIDGARWDPATRVWQFPNEIGTAMKIVNSLHPEMSAEVNGWIREAGTQIAEELTTLHGIDADVLVPWGGRLFDYQRADVDFFAEHPRSINANEMGLGKTIESLSAVAEQLLRYRYEYASKLRVGETESRASSSTRANGDSEAPSEDQSNHYGGQESSMRGLRDSASSGAYGLGSRSGEEVVRARPVDEETTSIGSEQSRGSRTERNREMRRTLLELSSSTTFHGLVIGPSSSLHGWKREIEEGPESWPDGEWVPQRAHLIDARTKIARRKQLADAVAAGGWILVNWEKVRYDTKKLSKMPLPEIFKVKFDAVIADEAHRAKNPEAQQTKGLWKFEAPIQLALSGTPVQNHPGDLWSLLRWIRPEQFSRANAGGGYWAFHHTYVDDYAGYKGHRVITGVKNPDGLRFLLADKLVRHLKKDVLKSLPDKLPPIHVEVDMTPVQKTLYKTAENKMWLEIDEAIEKGEVDPTSVATAVRDGDAKKLQYLIPNGVARMTRLRQIRSSPAILGGEDSSGPMDAVMEIIKDADPEKKFVVFTWYRETADLLVARLNRQKPPISAEAYHGGVPMGDARKEMEERFQQGDLRIIVGTIETMGESIDLYAADTAIFLERGWVPGKNNQALDRLHRHGQKNVVTPIIIEAVDTIDTGRLAETNKRKELMATQLGLG